ncbi:hypothetical protein L3C06_09195 [Lacticaseibacillus paracasei subsp. paracasei]|uniref:hypothetical protein n=1 Tax=Lacticaseibacillus paracasei TaxID=1597 RepID=UPI001F316001|nr:hypothetical protein [Lacticaseibacillus paracasei]UJS06788.1 hypothetical protein L3C06_09195 [Lacticaseibacillus paracasei subsp. paracasei]
MTSNETKWDVFVDAVDALADAQASGGNVGHQDANLFMAEYEKALPDDLPVIPEAVSDHIKESMENDLRLDDALMSVPEKFNDVKEPISGYAFYRAWLLGVWRVEETGEIVKLEEEK